MSDSSDELVTASTTQPLKELNPAPWQDAVPHPSCKGCTTSSSVKLSQAVDSDGKNLSHPVCPTISHMNVPPCLTLATTYYEQVQDFYAKTHSWYVKRKEKLKCYSKILKFLALLFGILGALMPVSQPLLDEFFVSDDYSIDSLGYVLLGISAGLVYYDKMFGISTGWMRSINTMNQLKNIANRYDAKWVQIHIPLLCRVPQDGSIENWEYILQQSERIAKMAEEFNSDILRCLDRETQLWITEFQSNLAHMQSRTENTLAQGKQQPPKA
ncbi:MAG: SLATT domain-containing protein [Magnetococcales bacterium]|nr:SLATT domain-containing protein [Magnetococcales bacterium]MBF0115735.1 SLATT domain-containing protein [Magnetococcales bacterium]